MANTAKTSKKSKNQSKISKNLIIALLAAGVLLLIVGALFAANVLPLSRAGADAVVSNIMLMEDMPEGIGGTSDFITVGYTANGEFVTATIRGDARDYHIGQHITVSYLRSNPTKLVSSEPYYIAAFVLLLLGAGAAAAGAGLALKKRSDEKDGKK